MFYYCNPEGNAIFMTMKSVTRLKSNLTLFASILETDFQFLDMSDSVLTFFSRFWPLVTAIMSFVFGPDVPSIHPHVLLVSSMVCHL